MQRRVTGGLSRDEKKGLLTYAVYEIDEVNVKRFVAESGCESFGKWHLPECASCMAIKPIPSAQYQTGWRRDTRVRDIVINEEEGSEGLCTPSLAAPWRVVEVKEEADYSTEQTLKARDP